MPTIRRTPVLGNRKVPVGDGPRASYRLLAQPFVHAEPGTSHRLTSKEGFEVLSPVTRRHRLTARTRNEPSLAEDVPEAFELTRLHQPDVVLMDVRMPVLDRITATAASSWSRCPPGCWC